ncbi:MAG: T9SS type A sorting domain-containing protein [Crocinitomicaceae bacterium]|nr:T9SS type A sorting domain-containing protein [Crocinitomicaceae bacterium]
MEHKLNTVFVTKLLLAVALLLGGGYSYSQNMVWAKNYPTSNYAAHFRLNADLYGNVFESRFGGVTKYDPDGNALWGRSYGGYGSVNAYNAYTGRQQCGTLSNGNIIVSMQYECSVGPYDSDATTGVNLVSEIPSNSGYACEFIACYDTYGNFVWSNSIDGIVRDVAIDNNDNIHVLVNRSINESLVTLKKLTSDGIEYYEIDLTGGDGMVVKVDSFGNTYTLSNSMIGAVTPSVSVSKIASNGNVAWSRNFQSTNSNVGNHLATDMTILSNGSCVFGGRLSYWTAFDSFPLASGGFLCKLDSLGVTVDLIDLNSGDYVYSIVSDEFDNLYIGGSFGGSIDCDFGPDTSYIYSSGGGAYSDGFLIKTDSSFNYKWSHYFGNNIGSSNVFGFSRVEDLAVHNGFLYGRGNTRDTIALDSFGLIGDTLFSGEWSVNSYHHRFLFKMETDSCSSMNISIDSLSNITCSDPAFIEIHGEGGSGSYNYDWGLSSPIDTNVIQTNQSGNHIVTVTDSIGCISTLSFSLEAAGNLGLWDLNSILVPADFQNGMETTLLLNGFNEECTPVNGEMIFIIDSQTSFVSSNPTPDVISSDTLVWYFNNLNYGNYIDAQVNVLVSPSAQNGDELCFRAIMSPITGDNDTTNNIKDYCFSVGSSFESVRKDVHPQGDCIPNYIDSNEVLTYVIQWNNNSLDTVVNIMIEDSLDNSLDISTMTIVSSSHPYYLEVIGNVFRVHYNGVLLPDSVSDPVGSNAYLAFEIMPSNGIPYGTVIENYARVFYDYNGPMLTNEVFNTISDGNNDTSFVELYLTECDSVLWNSNYYSNSGLYSFVNSNSYGCDSTTWLDLTINQSTSGSIFENGLDSVVVNGQVYLSSGSYEQLLVNMNGCDSILTIDVALDYSGLKSEEFTSFLIYPNPTHVNVRITGLNLNQGPFRFVLLDMQGRIVKDEEVDDTQYLVELPYSGMFVLKVLNGDGIFNVVKVVRN